MSTPDCGRSPHLERARELLFPDLPDTEAWDRIDAAFAGAADERRWARVEAHATQQELEAALVARARRPNDRD